MRTWQVLVDANNFFVSCERLFQPELMGKPVIVMSSNEGCVLARSNEAKRLGVKMGETFFQLRERSLQHQLIVRCCNFPLYGDISRRLMKMLSNLLPKCEVYSIDEAFGQIDSDDSEAIIDKMAQIRQGIWRSLGIPVSLAAASTRVRCKLAIDDAKRESSGVIVMPQEADEWLARSAIGQVWGVGRRWEEKLRSHGVYTAYDFVHREIGWVRSLMGVEGERLLLELRGVACKHRLISRHQSMQIFRSFGSHLGDKAMLADALSAFAHSMGEKLRQHQLLICSLAIQFYDSVKGRPKLVHESVQRMPGPTQDTRDLLHACQVALAQLQMPASGIKKAGIVAMAIIPRGVGDESFQTDLFSESRRPTPVSNRLMLVLDQVKERYGRNKINLGPHSHAEQWQPKSDSRSANFTTSWEGLPRVRI